MKKLSNLMFLVLTLGLASCSSDEPLNIECDIECIEIDVPNKTDFFISTTGNRIDLTDKLPEDTIRFQIRVDEENVASYATHLTVVPGSQVFMLDLQNKLTETPFQDGQVVDYSKKNDEGCRAIFLVRSQSGEWARRYFVKFEKYTPPSVAKGRFDIIFDFNGNYVSDASGKFFEWIETDKYAQSIFKSGDAKWRNGNPGYKLSVSSAAAYDYPTAPVQGGGPDGSDCIKLQTMDTGAFGAMVDCPNASGSLFNGEFDVTNALKNARLATKFGNPFTFAPVKLEADLRLEGAGVIDGQFMDEPDIYCVIYDNLGGTLQLNGNDVLTNPNIIGIARLPHYYNGINDQTTMSPIHGIGSEWKHVELYVDYTPWTKEVMDTLVDEEVEKRFDLEKLKNFGYSMVVGASSSWQGGYFHANVGTKFYIDNIKVVCVNPYSDSDEPIEEEQTEFNGTAVMDFNYDANVVERKFNNNNVRYFEWTETEKNLKLSLFSDYDTWGTSNEAFMLYQLSLTEDQCPVVVDNNGFEGKAVKLQTLDSRMKGPMPFGLMLGYNFIPGMLYTGQLDINSNNLKSNPAEDGSIHKNLYDYTRLGVPFRWKPTTLSAYLKYKAGAKYVDSSNKAVEGKTDQPELYIVVYKNTGEYVLTADKLTTALYSNEQSELDDLHVVGRGHMPHPFSLSDKEYTKVSINVEWLKNLSPADFEDGQYSVVIGAMSSYNGTKKEGAVGSTLSIDKIVLETAK